MVFVIRKDKCLFCGDTGQGIIRFEKLDPPIIYVCCKNCSFIAIHSMAETAVKERDKIRFIERQIAVVKKNMNKTHEMSKGAGLLGNILGIITDDLKYRWFWIRLYFYERQAK